MHFCKALKNSFAQKVRYAEKISRAKSQRRKENPLEAR
jgi:hypothetical protein